MFKKRTRVAGFTLIELLTVVAILAVLAGLLLSSLAGAKESAKVTKCLSNLRQIAMAINFYGDDNAGRYPPSQVTETNSPFLKDLKQTIGGFDPLPRLMPCYASAKARPLYLYLEPSEVYRCPSDKGQEGWPTCPGCSPPLKPSNWETIGCSYQYNAGSLAHLIGGGFKSKPENEESGLALQAHEWVPQPSLYILLHEPPARIYNAPDGPPLWFQWHYSGSRSDFDDVKKAPAKFVSPIAFADGHVAKHDFSKSLSKDPSFPYEPTKDWIWYKPSASSIRVN